MLQTGIVSVTFRKKTIDEIISLARANSLDCVEVGSDVHAPKDDLENCRRIASLAAGNGVSIVSYGSYYTLGENELPEAEFDGYIKAAKALGAPNIRVWAGRCGKYGSRSVSPDVRASMVNEAKLIAKAAKNAGLTISFEYHPGTLTDEPESARRLIDEIGTDNVSLYFQPDQGKDTDYNVAALRTVIDRVSNIHVFAWDARGGSCIRYPLADFSDRWNRYLDVINDGRDHALLMEFVKDDSESQFAIDAETLNEWRKRYV